MIPIASIFDVASDLGYPVIFLIIVLETGCGIPFAPGELATLTGGIAAAEGKLELGWVIAVSAAGAIVGDNIGYMIGRLGGRRLLERPGPFENQRRQVLAIADPYFEHHGRKTVVIGRWLPVLRVYTSWLAGGSRMPWGTFLIWNAGGGILWAAGIGLLGYFGGAVAVTVLEDLGKFGPVVVIPGIIVAVLVFRRQQRRAVDRVRTQSQELRALSMTDVPPPASAEAPSSGS
jgi:membrane protein DedA with SNARE-associated domain